MNNLYRMELMSLLSDLDACLEKIFTDYGFYESEKMTMKDFKKQVLKDYSEVYNSEE